MLHSRDSSAWVLVVVLFLIACLVLWLREQGQRYVPPTPTAPIGCGFNPGEANDAEGIGTALDGWRNRLWGLRLAGTYDPD